MSQDVRSQAGVPYALDTLWAIEPNAFGKLRELVASATPEQINAAAGETNENRASDRKPYDLRGSAAVIRFEGVVTKRSTVWSRIFGGRAVTSDTKAAIDAALADDAVKSILLVIDSPGGTVNGTSDLADAVHAANKKKPITAYAEDLAASAAYWVGSQASRFVGNSTATVGSIGVFAVVPDFSRMAKNLGVEVNVVKSAPGKGAGAFGTQVDDAQLADLQREVDHVHQKFVEAVARGRGISLEKAATLADGRCHVGGAAVACGLLDAVESLDAVAESMQPKLEPVPDLMVATVTVGGCPQCDAGVIHTIHPTTQGAAAQLPAQSTEEADMEATQEQAAKLEAVTKELAELRAGLGTVSGSVASIEQTRALDALIEQARADVKVTKGNEEALVPAIRATAAKSIDAARAMVEALPKLGKGEGKVDGDKPIGATSAGREPGDHIGAHLGMYDPKGHEPHKLAVDYLAKSRQAGRPVRYHQAYLAVTTPSAA